MEYGRGRDIDEGNVKKKKDRIKRIKRIDPVEFQRDLKRQRIKICKKLNRRERQIERGTAEKGEEIESCLPP